MERANLVCDVDATVPWLKASCWQSCCHGHPSKSSDYVQVGASYAVETGASSAFWCPQTTVFSAHHEARARQPSHGREAVRRSLSRDKVNCSSCL